MPYDNTSINNFVQKQGGSLQNLGASPTYTGAPANKGTPPGPQNKQPYIQANPNASFQSPRQQDLQAGRNFNQGAMSEYENMRPRMPGQMPPMQNQRPPMPGQRPPAVGQGQRPPMAGQRPPMDPRMGMPQTSLANLGNRMDPRMQQQMMQQRQQQQVDPRQDPRYRQRMEMIRRQRMSNPRRGNLSRLGQRQESPNMTTAPVQPMWMQPNMSTYQGR